MANQFFNLLKEEHVRVMETIDDLKEVQDESELESLFQDLKISLLAHLRGEEKTFYPILKSKAELRDMALQAMEEHHVAKLLLKELEEFDFSDERWHAKLTVFQEILEHHIEEEESEIFEEAENFLTDEQLRRIFEEYKKISQQQLESIT